MDRNTKLTLAELIRRKEQMLDERRRNAEAELYIPSLDADITRVCHLKKEKSRIIILVNVIIAGFCA